MANKTAAGAAEKPADKVMPVYSAAEFADNADALFGARKECVVAALKVAKIKSCTLSEAKEIVTAFMNKEVK